MTYFKENIRILRHTLNLSQESMVTHVGVKRQLYQAWETGRSKANHEDLAKISETTGISIDDLLKKPIVMEPVKS